MQSLTKSTEIRGISGMTIPLGDKVHKQEVVPLYCIDKVQKQCPQCPLSHTHQMSVSQFKVDEYRQCTLEFFRWAIDASCVNWLEEETRMWKETTDFTIKMVQWQQTNPWFSFLIHPHAIPLYYTIIWWYVMTFIIIQKLIWSIATHY